MCSSAFIFSGLVGLATGLAVVFLLLVEMCLRRAGNRLRVQRDQLKAALDAKSVIRDWARRQRAVKP